MIVFASIVPHPPFSIPGAGRKDDFMKLKNTLESFAKLKEELEDARPDTIVIISPHAEMEPYNFVINSKNKLQGDLSEFEVNWEVAYKNDLELVDEITYTCEMNEEFIHCHENVLDHGAVIPLFHLAQGLKKKPKILHLSFSLLDYEKHYSYGRLLGKIFSAHIKRIAVVASGSLSHRLSDKSPLGYNSNAKVFDRRVIEMMTSGDIDSIVKLHKELAEESAECGLRSFLILLGVINKSSLSRFELLSYEHPFGIGYLCARFY